MLFIRNNGHSKLKFIAPTQNATDPAPQRDRSQLVIHVEEDSEV